MRKILLSENDMPKAWYNVQADLPKPLAPVLHPGTKKPVGPQDLAPIFPMALIAQEVSTERWIEIPQPVQEVLSLWRPTPRPTRISGTSSATAPGTKSGTTRMPWAWLTRWPTT